jgi:hypothetical protein
MIRASRLLAATMLVAVAAGACGGGGAATREGVEAQGATSAGTEGGRSVPPVDPSTTPGGVGTTPTDLLPNASTQDDMKTFVYAFYDAANLTAESAALTETAQSLSASVAARDYDAAKSFAQQMLGQANQLESSARAASDRLRLLGPGDGTLIRARKDGLATFDLTAEYAATATDLAEAALALDATAAASVTRQALSLLGTADELTSWYPALTNELESWASANPSAAAKAIVLYA